MWLGQNGLYTVLQHEHSDDHQAAAGQPDNPGVFGRDRAAAIHDFQADPTSPGASEWGHIAAERAGTNGQVNRDYRDQNGGTPSHGNDTDTGDTDTGGTGTGGSL